MGGRVKEHTAGGRFAAPKGSWGGNQDITNVETARETEWPLLGASTRP